MRISRIYTNQALTPDRQLALDGQAGHYVFRVLKLREGSPLVLFNGDGCDYAAELLSNRRDRVELRVTARLPALPESPLTVTLVQAIGKGDRMDLSLQKATELGISAVVPLISERTEVRLDDERLERRMAHWRSVVVSACEQSGRATVPALAEPVELEQWLTQDAVRSRFVLDPGAGQSLAGQTLDTDTAAVAIAVGPEGGFSERELKLCQLAGVRAAHLGPRVLRTETAGPAALVILQAMHGDLR